MVDNRCSILGCNQFEKVNPFLLGPIFEFICLFTQFSLDFQQKSSQTIIFLFSSPENSTKNYFVIQVLRNAMAALGLAKVSVLKHTENVELSANEVVAEKIEG